MLLLENTQFKQNKGLCPTSIQSSCGPKVIEL